MPSTSTESKCKLKTAKPSLCISTAKEKASIKTSNLWFHKRFYKLDGKSKNQWRRKKKTAYRSSQTTEQSFRSQGPRIHNSSLC